MSLADHLPVRALRREGAPLAISLVVHLVALLLIAPWLVMRTIPSQPIEVEVLLEPDASQPPRSTPKTASRLRAPETLPNLLTKPSILPLPPRPVRPAAPEPTRQAAASQAPGPRGQAAPAPREAATLSAPRPARSASAPAAIGSPALTRGPSTASAAAPRLPSEAHAPQPSARAMASPSRPGNDRQDGLVALNAPAAQAHTSQPEFRQASRQGGQTGMRGGSQAPDEGVARHAGTPDQVALAASRAAPPSNTGSAASRGGAVPQVAVPLARLSGQGGVVAAETRTAGLEQSAAPVAGAATPGRSPVSAGQSLSPATAVSASRSVSPAERSGGWMAAAASPAVGAEAAVPSRASGSSGGQATAPSGAGSPSRAAGPAESGSGLLAAASPHAAGPGAAPAGAGPGAGLSGEGRAQPASGGSSAGRDAPAALLAAAGASAMAAPAAADGGAGQLSGRTEAPVQTAREARAAPLQPQQPNGQARVIEERFTASALKVDSPRSICELPLLFAGFDRKPIPKGLDSINATAASLPGETPPRHHPGNEAPRYPMQALGSRAEGRVLVRAEIQSDGRIGKLWIKQSSGTQVLDLAALETVRNWRFTPAQRHGMPVAMWLDVPIEYKLPKE